jgi:tetratricopeptide (TPR) repeat protein
VDLSGLEPRRSDLARGIVIARSARPLDEAAQRALWDALAKAGVTEPGEPSEPDLPERDPAEGQAQAEGGPEGEGEGEPEPARQWLAAPWLPPLPAELDGQRAALEAAAAAHGLEAIWCVKIETGVDGVAWRELGGGEGRGRGDDDEDEDDPEAGTSAPGEGEVVDGLLEEAEVLYTAPDAPASVAAGEGAGAAAGDDDDDDEELEEDDDLVDELDEDDDLEDDALVESHWRNGLPPLEHAVPFPIERYPEVLEDYDGERFGVALKLAGSGLPGEESVINAFFALWLSVYQDERADDLEPFQRADVVHDRRHRSALMWVERFSVPATASEQVHFLLWIVARIHDVLPVAWARFESVDDTVRARADGVDGRDPFILAGNPFAERFRRHGEESALLWAVSQSAWSRRELAGMLIEVALEHDPDDPVAAAVAERLLRRSLSFDPASDATGYLVIVLVRQRRLADAVALAHTAQGRDARMLAVGEIAERAPGELGPALELLDAETVAGLPPEELADLVGEVARHAPAYLSAMLGRLPEDVALVPYLYNASFSVERPAALAILRKVLALPTPAPSAGEARTALVMAWNNACIHAHALGDYPLAVELADGGQRYAPENPYIYHSAACAYAAVGDIPRALEQVKQAIEHDYEHSEKMETDPDLGPLHDDPRFSALFVEWRTRRADLN